MRKNLVMECVRFIFYAWTQVCKTKLLHRTLCYHFSFDANVAYETKFESKCLISMY